MMFVSSPAAAHAVDAASTFSTAAKNSVLQSTAVTVCLARNRCAVFSSRGCMCGPGEMFDARLALRGDEEAVILVIVARRRGVFMVDGTRR